jgi:2,5-diamino-6-(ribosylamino)-4(3H)-pyrimidinone 5'-phosphate reductase
MVRPRISTNLAISADGKISSASRVPARWTSAADQQRLHDLRHGADAILVGRGTFETDRMTMTAPNHPLRCIVSRNGVIDPTHPIFSRPGGPIHLLVTGAQEVAAPPSVEVHRTDLPGFLRELATHHGVARLHCEGGGELIRSLAELDAIDEFHATIAGHAIFGGADAPTPTGVPGDFLPSTRLFRIAAFEPRPDLGECFVSWVRKDDG